MNTAQAIALLSAVGLSACVPFPHRANLTPGVSGSITANGAPVSSTRVRLVASENPNSPCNGESREFQTTNAGLFYGAPVRTFSWVMVVMAHRQFPWALCIENQDQWVPVHQDRIYTLVDTGPAILVEMQCTNQEVSWQCQAEENWGPSPEKISELEKRNL